MFRLFLILTLSASTIVAMEPETFTFFQELPQKEISDRIAKFSAANNIRERLKEKENYFLKDNCLYSKVEKNSLGQNKCILKGPSRFLALYYIPNIIDFGFNKKNIILLDRTSHPAVPVLHIYDKVTKEKKETIYSHDIFMNDKQQTFSPLGIVLNRSLECFSLSEDEKNLFVISRFSNNIQKHLLNDTQDSSFWNQLNQQDKEPHLIWLTKNPTINNEWKIKEITALENKNYQAIAFFEHLLPENGAPNHIALVEKPINPNEQGNISLINLTNEPLPIKTIEEYLASKQSNTTQEIKSLENQDIQKSSSLFNTKSVFLGLAVIGGLWFAKDYLPEALSTICKWFTPWRKS
jgi:hypothetical protein